jgi:hypothetical protein
MEKRDTKPISGKIRRLIIKLKLKNFIWSDISEKTNTSISTCRRIWRLYNSGKNIEKVEKPNHQLYYNPNAKITKNFIDEFLKSIEQYPDKTDEERRFYLKDITGILLSKSEINHLQIQLHCTSKNKTILYEDRFTKQNIKNKKNFENLHDPIKGSISLINCAVTDEAGVQNDVIRRRGRSIIRTHSLSIKYPFLKIPKPTINRNLNLIGKNNASRIYGVKPKHPRFKLNVVLTLCLNPNNWIPGYKVTTKYINGVEYAKFINKRHLPNNVTHDIIDKAPSHIANKINVKRNYLPVHEIYNKVGIVMDFSTPGVPEQKPVEEAFSFMKSYIHKKATQYNLGDGWSESDLRKVLLEAKSKITYDMVKSWYKNTFIQMYPNYKIPNYLK